MRIPGLVLIALISASAAARAQIPIQKVYAEVRIDQHPGAALPLDLPFRDEEGSPVTLGKYFHRSPVVLAFVYYRCPMLCTQVLNALVEGLRSLPFAAGREYQVVAVSIDPRETPDLAREKKEHYMRVFARPPEEPGWHFLTGPESSIAAEAQAAGFRYLYDSTSDQYAHAAGVMILTPEGKLSRYLFGIQYEPKDLKFALMEASHGRIGSLVDRVLLLCYHYDPLTGKYGSVIMNVFRAGGALTILLLGGGILLLLRGERRRRSRQAAGAQGTP